MKFFTLDWWMGVQTDRSGGDAAERYAEHWAKLSLPDEVRTFAESVSLHDGHLRAFAYDAAKARLTLTVAIPTSSSERQDIQLCYDGVKSIRSSADPDKSLSGPGGYGDLGYDEWHRAGEALEHRMLFSSGIELAVVFTALQTG